MTRMDAALAGRSSRWRLVCASAGLAVVWRLPTALVLPAPRGVVSFDLDDTLWPTVRVVSGANRRLQQWLGTQLATEPGDVQAEMTSIRRARAAEAAARGVAAPPTNYRRMRGEGIKAAAAGAGLDAEFLERLAREGMAVWEQARHDCAEESLDPHAVPALQELQAQGLRLCAVTNGLGSTDFVPSLAPLFDFTHIAEGDLKKPHPHAFEQAVARYAPGTPWVHVGDSLRDDVGGATLAGLRTVLVQRETPSTASEEWLQSRKAAEKAKQAEAREVDRAALAAARVGVRISCLTDLAQAVQELFAPAQA
uniref:Haloacid dehalogenase-like hydrolase domain-containing protein 3 n=1 Tax=Alexandrium monilatum TaxID=311494 RepID=A0A7S4UMS1_9DINO|mmetsp:Transcript_9444/g.28443  ORF Transcript_9444/g.28443 Transcript_9444/m.28443 type:complete len:309 (-) Transcript_9444:172-1098(-)